VNVLLKFAFPVPDTAQDDTLLQVPFLFSSRNIVPEIRVLFLCAITLIDDVMVRPEIEMLARALLVSDQSSPITAG